jgi:uncharacterized repeat protein (TIGR03803 family)
MKNFYTTILSTLITIANYAQSPHAAQLYGMTQYGSNNSKGTIFHYTPSTNTFTTDYVFQVKVKGKTPKCEIVAGSNGKYYGTTSAGGDFNAGVLFEWDSVTSVYKDLYNFTGIDGRNACGGMVLHNNKLYGMTNEGGVNNHGVIYEWDIASNTFTNKIDLDSANGRNPTGSLSLLNNIFYGFTSSGGANDKGVLFEWNPSTNVYTKKFDFDSIKGSNPVGKLQLFNGGFYAMCNKGGSFNVGTIYQWDYTNNIVTKTFDFNNINGAFPTNRLTLHNNKFYGTTYEGGIYQTNLSWEHYGVIFEYNPANNVFIKKKNLGFQGGLRGSLGSLTLKDNILWGTATDDGLSRGGIFTWNPVTNQFVSKYGFAVFTQTPCEIERPAIGFAPFETMLVSGNYLIGTLSEGASNFFGTLFKYSIDSNQIVSLVNMQATDGAYPKGSLTKVGNKLYGLTFQGGNAHAGNIFEWDLTTQQFKERFQLDGYTTGIWPKGSLTWHNGKLYGTTSAGKLAFGGNFTQRETGDYFSWEPATNIYQSLFFAGPSMSTPILQNNKLYSTTPNFIDNFVATIYEFNPLADTVIYAANFPDSFGNFSHYQGYEGANGVTYYNGKFYGMTTGKVSSGNIPHRGTIYEWDTTTNVTTHRYDFVDSLGTYPTGNLLLVGNEFYGITSNYANISSSFPCLFTWNPATNVYTRKNQIFGDYPFGTPTLSGGKIYFMKEGSFLQLFEYDPILDTTIIVHNEPIPLFQIGGNWNYTNCQRPPSYTQLLEVIPNKDPILSNIPTTQTVCSNENNTVTFIISDADNDTMSFQMTSSNTALIPVANISITNTDSVYTINYTIIGNQSGIDTISITANDGYGGMLNFSFVIIVNAAPIATVTPNNTTTICFGEQIALNANVGTGLSYQWQVDSTNIIGATSINYIANTAGNYSVIVANSSACSSISTATILIVDSLPYTGVTQNQTTLTANQNGANYQWIDCDNNSTIAGANNQTFTATLSGNYAVAITTNNCSDTSDCISVLVNTVDVKATVIDNSFTIYPNPTSGQFTIVLPTENASIIVTNLMGQEIIKERATQKTTTLQLDTNGVYIVYLKTKKGTTIQKLIVNR